MGRCLIYLITLATAFVAATRGATVCAQDAASVRVEILVADAEKLYRADHPKQAVAKYDQAGALAFSEGATGRAFELSRTAAAILHSVGEDAEAGQRLRRLAIANVSHLEAAATHRTALVLLASQRDAAPDSREVYEEALREHLDQWPDARSAREAEAWLINRLAASRQWAELLPLLEAVPVEDPRFAAVAGLYADAVIGVRQGNESTELLRRATKKLQPTITGADNQWPADWEPHQREAALSLARIHLAFGVAGPQYPYRLLAAASAGSPPPSRQWRADALPLLVEAAITADKPAKALEAAERIPLSDSPALRRLVKFLEARLGTAPTDQALSQTLLSVTRQAEQGGAPDWLRQGRAAALAATGEHEAARAVLARMGDQRPNDPAFLRLSALTLADRPDEESRQQALALWRRIEAAQKPGGPPWHEARLSRIELLARLDRREEARKLFSLTTALYPPPQSVDLSERRAALARSLGVDEKK